MKKPDKTFVVAVSGGVDSVSLLHMLVSGQILPPSNLVVAHFDHGIRADSEKDRVFTQRLADKYGLPFEYAEGKLGPNASEAAAREARYSFLNKIKRKYRAQAIVTAHHQDDMIETAIINLLRGTHRKGLGSLSSDSQLLRPLLDLSKAEILDYARKHKLKWREDPTNNDDIYLRNYIRLKLVPILHSNPNWREEFLEKINRGKELNQQINELLSDLSDGAVVSEKSTLKLPRRWFINLPNEVAREVLKSAIVKSGQPVELDRKLLTRAQLFAKTGQNGKKMSLGKNLELKLSQAEITLVPVTASGF